MSIETQPATDLRDVVIVAICKVAGWDPYAPIKGGVWLPHDMINVADEVLISLDLPGIRREAQREVLEKLRDHAHRARTQSGEPSVVIPKEAWNSTWDAVADAATPTGGEL